MKWNKQLRTCAVGLALLLALSGCGKPGEAGASGDEPDPTYISQSVREGLSVEAPVRGVPAGVQPKVYEGKLPALDRQVIDAFLDHVGDSVADIHYDGEEDGRWTFIAGTSHGGYLDAVLNPGDNNFVAYHFSYKTEQGKWYDNVLLDYGPLVREEYAIEDNTDLYTEPREFAFATVDQAVADVKEDLAVLGIHNVMVAETYYLDHTIMAEAERSETMLEKLTKGGAVEAVFKEVWTEADDAYYFRFDFDCEGVTMLPYSFTRTTYTYPGSTFTVIYNKDGIAEIMLEFPWQFGAVVETPEEMLSTRMALDRALENIGAASTPYARVVDEISLRYYFVQDGDRWLLRPCWLVSVLEKDAMQLADGTKDTHSYVILDAVTGAEL